MQGSCDCMLILTEKDGSDLCLCLFALRVNAAEAMAWPQASPACRALGEPLHFDDLPLEDGLFLML